MRGIQIWSRSFPAWIARRSRLSFMRFVICTPSEVIQPLMESWITILTKLDGITSPIKTQNTVKLTQQLMRSLSITDSGISSQSSRLRARKPAPTRTFFIALAGTSRRQSWSIYVYFVEIIWLKRWVVVVGRLGIVKQTNDIEIIILLSWNSFFF